MRMVVINDTIPVRSLLLHAHCPQVDRQYKGLKTISFYKLNVASSMIAKCRILHVSKLGQRNRSLRGTRRTKLNMFN